MSKPWTAAYNRNAYAVNATENRLVMIQIDDAALSEPVRVVRDNDDYPYGAAYQFVASAAVVNGQIITPTHENPDLAYNGRYYEVVGTGNLGTSQPVLPTVIDDTVVSGGVSLKCKGYQYRAVAFDIKLPSQLSQGNGRAQIVIDNVDKSLVGWLEVSNYGEAATLTIREGLRSEPEVFVTDMAMDMFDVSIRQNAITAELGWETYHNMPAVVLTYRPDNSPGIFLNV